MVHDLIVNFYCKSSDREPKYRSPVGIFTKGEKVLSKEGFKRAGEGYYLDYEKERSETELPKWKEEEYRRHIRSSYTGWEYRYGIYIDDGWVYVYRNRGSTQSRTGLQIERRMGNACP